MTPSIEARVAVLRAVALHGPMPRATAECWHLEGVTPEEQAEAVRALLKAGPLVQAGGAVDLRGVDRTGWRDSMGPCERLARDEAIEACCRAAVLAAVATEPGATVAQRLAAVRESAALAVRGMAAAKAADVAKREGR